MLRTTTRFAKLKYAQNTRLAHFCESPFTLLIFAFACVWGVDARVSFAESPSREVSQVWRDFRDSRPEHFQDWVIDQSGPRFTLLYTEPPPAYSMDGYGDLLRSVFRGYQDHHIQSRPLGYNGLVHDLVIELDYQGIGDNPRAALGFDLRALSAAIYGTAHGARAIELEEVLAGNQGLNVPAPISVTAAQLWEWLLGAEPIRLISPERATAGTLEEIVDARISGRFISTDNSLVVLLVDRKSGIGPSLIPSIRRFAVDSDYILGGIVESSPEPQWVALVARSRQLPLGAFPALRVEDLLTAITAEDSGWAQSYDRSTPGAGKARISDGKLEDWAPSYLSADLIDTEFGSLLNWADAILKSQSLSDTIKYRGFPLQGFPDPPYPEGVFDRLQQEAQQTSLIFNFNTIGVGHWLEHDGEPDVYALNSTGSFSVTYSPETTGGDSTLAHAAVIQHAQDNYTKWFRDNRSYELVRTVQYMAVYQLFNSAALRGDRLYPDTSKKFSTIGAQLKEAVKIGAMASIADLSGTDSEKIASIDRARAFMQLMKGLGGVDLPPIPTTIEGLVKQLGDAATAIRYDGNLYGDQMSNLIDRYNRAVTQHQTTFSLIETSYDAYITASNAFEQRWKAYEIGETRKRIDGEWVTVMEYEFPDQQRSSVFNSQKASLQSSERSLAPALQYLDELHKRIDAMGKEIEQAESTYLENHLLLDSLAFALNLLDPEKLPTNVLSAFESRTSPEMFPASSFSILTPTIVVSVDGSGAADQVVGGHNIEVQRYGIRLDDSVRKGQFRIGVGELRINPADAGRMDSLSSRMAQVVNADPATQRRVFDEVMRTPLDSHTRSGSLGLRASKDAAKAPSPESIYIAAAEQRPPSAFASEDALTVGRDAKTSRLYIDQMGSDGKLHRSIVFGATKLPELLASKSRAQSLEVLLDDSLGARDIDAIISNVRRSGGLRTPSSGNGGSAPPPRKGWANAAADEPIEPRLLIFTDAANGRRRVIAETTHGRVELLIRRGVPEDQLLAALRTRIEQGAELSVNPTKQGKNGAGREYLLFDLRVRQATPIRSTATVSAPAGRKLLQSGRDWLSTMFRSVFSDVKNKEAADLTITDFIVEVKRRTEREQPDWNVDWIVDVDETGLRFVAVPRQCPGAATFSEEYTLTDAH